MRSFRLTTRRTIGITGRVLVTIILAIAFYIFVITPSVSIGIIVQNECDKDVTLYVIDTKRKTVRYFGLGKRIELFVPLCEGESREELDRRMFVLIGVDARGNVIHQEQVRVSDIEAEDRVVIQAATNGDSRAIGRPIADS